MPADGRAPKWTRVNLTTAMTALMIMARTSNVEAAKLLLKGGAKVR